MTRPSPVVRGLVTAAVLAAVTGLTVVGLGTAPAAAALCADAGGVSVVVDFREVGGGIATGCDADGGGKSAATLFADAGFALEYVQRQPGFVCRVNGAPAAASCVSTPPANAYWGLYWSNGTSGSWSYSSLGVGSLTVPAGGSVAFAWQGQAQGPPGVAAPSHAGSPTPSPSPTASPTPSGPTATPSSSSSPTKDADEVTDQAADHPGHRVAHPGWHRGLPRPVADPHHARCVAHGRRPGLGRPVDGPDPRRPERLDVVGRRVRLRLGVRVGRRSRPRPRHGTSDDADPSTSPDAEPSEVSPTADAPDQGGGSVPLPIVLVVMALLGAAVAGTVVLQAPPDMTRLPRDLHPVAWWLWALGLAAGASLTTNPLTLLMLIGVAAVVVSARRSDHAWSDSFRLYLGLGAVIVVTRVVFRLVLGGVDGGHVLLDLPEVPLPDWVPGIRLLGPVTRASLLAGLYDGLRLATIVICVGAANSLANPKRLLKSVPSALYEIGTALVVAVTVFPQLADSVRRVRAAQALRGGSPGRVGRLRRFLVPVLEDALERSLALAAGMDARGYGRAPGLGRGGRLRTGGLLLLGLCGICVGTYAVLDLTAPRVLAVPMLVGGAVAAFVGPVERRPPGGAHPLPTRGVARGRAGRVGLRDPGRRRDVAGGRDPAPARLPGSRRGPRRQRARPGRGPGGPGARGRGAAADDQHAGRTAGPDDRAQDAGRGR